MDVEQLDKFDEFRLADFCCLMEKENILLSWYIVKGNFYWGR